MQNDSHSYVVRIYRRSAVRGTTRNEIPELVGVVDDPESGERHSFHGIEELWRIISQGVLPEKRRLKDMGKVSP